MVLDGLLMFDILRMDGLSSTSTIQTEETILQTFKARLGGASKGAVAWWGILPSDDVAMEAMAHLYQYGCVWK